MRITVLLALLCFGLFGCSSEYGYEPDADPYKVFSSTMKKANKTDTHVMVVFGSEWCGDCRSFNKKLNEKPFSDTVEKNFSVMHVDVGNWDKNMAFTEHFGKPVGEGIPSIAIVGKDKSLYYVSLAGEFATARSAKTESLNEWFVERLEAIDASIKEDAVVQKVDII